MDELLPPSNPKPGEVFPIPEGHEESNHSQVLSIYQHGKCVGFIDGIKKVPNVSGAYTLERSYLSTELHEGESIEIHTNMFPVQTVTFVNFFGWITKEYRNEPKLLWSKPFTVVALSRIPHPGRGQYLYERICLQEYKEKTE